MKKKKKVFHSIHEFVKEYFPDSEIEIKIVRKKNKPLYEYINTIEKAHKKTAKSKFKKEDLSKSYIHHRERPNTNPPDRRK